MLSKMRGWRPLKDTVSAQKVLLGSETKTKELLGGMDKNSVYSDFIYHWHWFRNYKIFENTFEKLTFISNIHGCTLDIWQNFRKFSNWVICQTCFWGSGCSACFCLAGGGGGVGSDTPNRAAPWLTADDWGTLGVGCENALEVACWVKWGH